jgi:hypothetical protein
LHRAGRSGLGKSRLLDELLQLVDVRATTLQGPPRMVARAHAASQGQPYFVLRELLANWLQITDSDTADSARLRVSVRVWNPTSQARAKPRFICWAS